MPVLVLSASVLAIVLIAVDALRGDQIPLGAQIIAACGAFDAMTSTRPHRAAMSVAEPLEELQRCAGTQFDPRVVSAFAPVAESVLRETTPREAGR